MDNNKKKLISGFIVLIFIATVSGESFIWIQIKNQIGTDELSDTVFIYQNNNLSRRFIKEQNYTDQTIRLNAGVSYDLYIPANPRHIVKNPEHNNWINFTFYSFWTIGLFSLLLILILIFVTPFVKRLTK